MTNGQNAARARHLEDLATAAKRYTLREILDVTNAVATELENFTADDFTGATTNTAGLSGLVPAPSAGDVVNFLRGDGTWANPLMTNIEYVIGSKVSNVEGGFWQDNINGTPILKLRHGDYEYNFHYDNVTYLGSETTPVVTTTPNTYVIGSTSSTVDGGVWYEVADNTPTLHMHRGSFNYSFNYDSITYKGGNKNLVSFLPFDTSTTADACGNTWTPNDATKVSLDTENKKFGAASLKLNKTYMKAENIINFTDSAWTFDCWVYNPCQYTNVRLGGNPGSAETGVDFSPSRLRVQSNESTLTTRMTDSTRWYHIAITRSNDKIYCFIDGTLSASVDVPADFSPTTAVQLNDTNNGTPHYDNVRFFQGVALWTTDFTPPTAADYA